MRNPKYHIYLTPDERRTVIIDELLIKLTKAKVKRIKVKEV